MSETAIRIENLSKMYKLYDKPTDRLKEALGFKKRVAYREHYALRDVNLTVKKGECVGIIGTNGAGKSTILKIITGVLNPTGGTLEINGRISALLELGAGFNMEYTGIENVYLNGTMIGFTREEIDAKLADILEFADIGDFVNQPVKMYSSGMFVRLAFAVAINIDPEILIVDEALSVGDVFFQAKCYHKFEEFKKQGKTILFVSHDLGSISKYCDRVMLLDHGRKLKEGDPKEIIDIYKKLLVNQYDPEGEEKKKPSDKKRQESADTLSWKSRIGQNPNALTYGNGLADIVDFGIMDENGTISNSVEKGAEFTIMMKVYFHERVTNPIFAFTIKDLKGTEITGTNTMYEDLDIPEAKAGEEKTVKFSQKMFLQGGEYLVSLGCTGFKGGEFTVYNRLYDIFNLTCISQKNTVGYYDMDSKVEME